MKNIIRTITAISLVFIGMAASAQEIPNFPLPQRPDTLRILGIGNSFTDDGMMYIPELLEAAGIQNVVLGRLYIGGCSLERHCNEYENNTTAYKYYKSTGNKWVTVSKETKMLDGLCDENWDIIVLQQQSSKAGNYETYQPWLDRMMEIIRWNCTNAGASIVWQHTWAYATTSDNKGFPKFDKDQTLMFNSLNASVKTMMERTSIDIIIPTCTAIQNMRNTEFNDELELTRDGYHLSHTAGRYTAACTWFQAIIAPCLKTTLAGNTCTLKGRTYKDKKGNVISAEITPELAKACQEAARRACIHPFTVWK